MATDPALDPYLPASRQAMPGSQPHKWVSKSSTSR